ncbi:MAG: DJ-1/PfpI family protein, partial [Methylocystis sp.]
MSEIDRRQFGDGVAAFAMLLTGGALAAPRASPEHAEGQHDMSDIPAYWRGKEKVAFLIYPGFTALDLVGPQYMFANLMGATIQIVAKSLDSVRSDSGLVFTPSARFEDAASKLDILCVPGGSTGTLAAMRDEETLAYIRAAGHGARYVTSVCTGSMLLGSAGLLDGYRATSHWLTKSLLPVFGATPAEGRFVRDRNRITAEGVTAGLDFALALIAELRDRKYAEGVQLLAQY